MGLTKRFLEYVNEKEPDECWEWTGAKSKGYGYLIFKSKGYRVNRVSWAIANKTWPVPEGMICHTCDNRECVNPAHLYLGDNTTNQQDRSPLTPENVREIRQLRIIGHTYKEIGSIFGVKHKNIGKICRYETWKEV